MLQSSQKVFSFTNIKNADLVVDALYEGGKTIKECPLNALLSVGNQGGFRYRGNTKLNKYSLVVLYSSLADLDWPDNLDTERGLFTYYGDNKIPGFDLLDTRRKGNKLLQYIFSAAHGSKEERLNVPPIFVFTKGGKGRDVVFRGLAVPGGNTLSQVDDLVAIWKTKGKIRFQNYKATFTILNEPVILRQWVNDLREGNTFSKACPKSFLEWAELKKFNVLISARSIEHRKKAEQLPQNPDEERIINVIRDKFKDNPYAFEKCAAAIARLMDSNIISLDLTRPWVDGGRDAIGLYRIGMENNAINVEFALEAKCYALNNAVGVKETSRLISRLRFRQFGILITTSYVHEQAYKEIKSDSHPVIILSATDIAKILKIHGYGNINELEQWLMAF